MPAGVGNTVAAKLATAVKVMREEVWQDLSSFLVLYIDASMPLSLKLVCDRHDKGRPGMTVWAEHAAFWLESEFNEFGFTVDHKAGTVTPPRFEREGSFELEYGYMVLFAWSETVHQGACEILLNAVPKLKAASLHCKSWRYIVFSSTIPPVDATDGAESARFGRVGAGDDSESESTTCPRPDEAKDEAARLSYDTARRPRLSADDS